MRRNGNEDEDHPESAEHLSFIERWGTTILYILLGLSLVMGFLGASKLPMKMWLASKGYY